MHAGEYVSRRKRKRKQERKNKKKHGKKIQWKKMYTTQWKIRKTNLPIIILVHFLCCIWKISAIIPKSCTIWVSLTMKVTFQTSLSLISDINKRKYDFFTRKMVEKWEQNFCCIVFDSSNLPSAESQMSDFFWRLLHILPSLSMIFCHCFGEILDANFDAHLKKLIKQKNNINLG